MLVHIYDSVLQELWKTKNYLSNGSFFISPLSDDSS